MPLVKKNTRNPIRGYKKPNAKQRKDCQAVINQLTYADLGRGAGTLHKFGEARLDMQGRTGKGGANLQVQISSFSTSAALVAHTLMNINNGVNQKGAVNGTISVLNQSLDTATIWELNGTLP